MVDAKNERRAEKRLGPRILWPPTTLQSSGKPWDRFSDGHVRHQAEYPGAGARDGARTQVVGGRVLGGRHREQDLEDLDGRKSGHAIYKVPDMLGVSGPLGWEERRGHSLVARPDEGRNLLDALLFGELHDVAPPVVKPATVDQGDPRLEHRRAPVQCALNNRFRVPPALLPLLEPPYILSPVTPGAPLPLHRLGTYHPPAHVRIQSRQTDPQLLRSPPGTEIPLLPHPITSSPGCTTIRPQPYYVLIRQSMLIHVLRRVTIGGSTVAREAGPRHERIGMGE